MKIEKDGILVGMTIIALLFGAYIIVPANIFEADSLVNCILGSAILLVFVEGIREQGKSKPHAKRETYQFFLSGYISFCLITIGTIAFANIKYEDKIDLAQCDVLFGGYLTIIYIVEKTIIARKEKREEERIKKHQAYLLQEELSRIKIGDIYIETTSKPLWEKEIWQVTKILDKKGEGRNIYLKDCLSKYRERIVSDFELIESYKCENHIFDYDFAYGNKLLDGYISILEDLSERKAIIEAKVRDSQLKKTSKFIGKTGDEISDEDYYDYLDYIVYSGEQKYKGQE